ncbi:hypothetical protein [Streptomyces roseolus]|uniref:hypothetical protein n=1 Tax=Streptomyces roseolus TaxID=67358 RepID=UPI001675119F|nr:hypothetical protein [Streptomyces roseolus]GGR51330.1 hypothetical protein GCM10010282_50270 [Streptomyces roseolus]
MPPATRKPAKKAAPRSRKPKNDTPVESPVSDTVETPETETETSKRKGPKPNPVSRVARAKANLLKARANAAKVERVAEALTAAEAEYKEAVEALQASLDDLDLDTVADVDE